MAVYIGIDIGSTTVSAAAIDTGSGALLESESALNSAEITTIADRALGRSEWDFSRITTIALGVVHDLVERIDGELVEGVGVTGQQQGCQLYDPDDLDDEDPKPIYQLLDVRAGKLLRKIPGAAACFLGFAWSPDGRLIAAHETARELSGWDVPVGSTLTQYVMVFDGRSGERLWQEKARDHGDFGWTPDGLVRCEGKLRDAATGQIVSQ